jgi:hypothetical protein
VPHAHARSLSRIVARETRIVIRRVLDDVGLDLSELEGVEVERSSAELDPAPWAPHEVLLVSDDADRLAQAHTLGLNRLLAADPSSTATAVAELCRALDHP